MTMFTYCFDELELIKGYAVTVAGEADISYEIYPPAPDEGIFSSYASDIEVTSIVLDSNKKGVPPINLDQTHWLYKLIYDALLENENLVCACENDAEGY